MNTLAQDKQKGKEGTGTEKWSNHCNGKLATALLPIQLCPPPLWDVVGWVKGWLAASQSGPLNLSPITWQSQWALHQQNYATHPVRKH